MSADTDDTNYFSKLLQTVRESKEFDVDDYLTNKHHSMRHYMRLGSHYFQSKCPAQSLMSYEQAMFYLEADPYPDEFKLSEQDVFTLKLCVCRALISMNDAQHTMRALQLLWVLASDCHYRHRAFVYLTLGNVYYKMGRYLQCLVALIPAVDVTLCCKQLYWPGTEKAIPATSGKTVQQDVDKLIVACKFKLATLTDMQCFYTLCSYTDRFLKRSTYFDGIVYVSCSNDCHYTYHKSCWEKHNDNTLKKHNANAVLETPCFSLICNGFICDVVTFDDKLNFKKQQKLSSGHLRNRKSSDASTSSSSASINSESNGKLQWGVLDKSNGRANNTAPSVRLKHALLCDMASIGTQTVWKLHSVSVQAAIPTRSKTSQTDETDALAQTDPSATENKELKDYKEMNENLKLKNATLKVTNEILNSDVAMLRGTLETKDHHLSEVINNNKSLADSLQNAHKTIQSFRFNQTCQRDIKSVETQTALQTKSKMSQTVNRNNTEMKEQKTINDLLKRQIAMLKTEIEKLQSERDARVEAARFERSQNTIQSLKVYLQNQVLCNQEIVLAFYKLNEIRCLEMCSDLNDLMTDPSNTIASFCQDLQENIDRWNSLLERTVNNKIFAKSKFDSHSELYQGFIIRSMTDCMENPSRNLFSNSYKHMLFLINKLKACEQNGKIVSTRTQALQTCDATDIADQVSGPPADIENEKLKSLRMQLYQPGTSSAPDIVNTKQEKTVKKLPKTQFVFGECGDFQINFHEMIVDANAIAQVQSLIGYELQKYCRKGSVEYQAYFRLVLSMKSYFPNVPNSELVQAIVIVKKEPKILSNNLHQEIVTEISRILSRDPITASIHSATTPGQPSPSTHKTWNSIDISLKEWNEDRADNYCSICLDFMHSSSTKHLTCLHKFHSKCIKRWLKNNSVCPICRTYITPEEFPPLNN